MSLLHHGFEGLRFARYEPTLASAAVEGCLIGLGCFLVLLVMIWLGRWVVDFFELDHSDDDEEVEP